jgi:hypothetical protein
MTWREKGFENPGPNGGASYLRLNKADIYYEVGAG